MIARVQHSEESEQDRFVPLRFDSERNQWVPLVPGESFEQPMDAGQACLGHLLASWRDLERLGRLLRVLCEHPGFQFESDGIDSDMVRVEARALASLLEAMSIELPELLREPTRADNVRLARPSSGHRPGATI